MTSRPFPTAPADSWMVGDYLLLDRIGEGGMGVVHLAEAPTGRRVALKVLRPHVVGDDEGRARLAREVSSLRRVESRWVAEVVDADPWGATPFVATRFVDGPSLHEHVRRHGPLVAEGLRQLATGLAEALTAVHRVGVLHRDVKPSNVLLEGHSPVLIDFGLARLAEDPRLTQTGWLMGTPGYLAPEILYGDDATTASDVHSWAATVAYAATGRPPFGTGPAMAIMDRVRRGEHDLSAVPPPFAGLVHACLAPDPAARPTLSQVLGTLRQLPRPVVFPRHDARTTRLPVAPAPTPRLRTRPLTVATRASAQQPARTPYVAPPSARAWPPPRTVGQAGPAEAPSVPAPTPRQGGLARLQRGLTLGGLGACTAIGFALAPYVALLTLAVLAFLVRTVSWSADAVGERRRLRGRRWWDRPLTLLTLPWYAVVATGGTVLLLATATCMAFGAGVAYLLFAGPLVPGLLLMGAVSAMSLWWGPGSRRLRVPTRRALWASTRRPWTGWLVAVAVVSLAVVLAGVLSTGEVVWDPQPGPPWREGTWLGALVGLLV